MDQWVSRPISRREYKEIVAAERRRINGRRIGAVLGLLLVPAIFAFENWRNSPRALTASHVQQLLDNERLLEFKSSEFEKCEDPAVGALIANSSRDATFTYVSLSESVQRELAKKKSGVLHFNTRYFEGLKPLLESSVALEFHDARMTPEDARLFSRHKGALGFYDMSLSQQDFEAVKAAFDAHPGPVWFALEYGWPGAGTKRLLIRKGYLPDGFLRDAYQDR
jgi:hypothetical protein